MTEPNWLRIDILIAVHKEIIAEFGGVEGVRDENLLMSSCNSPRHYYSNPKPTLAALAAKYAYTMSRNHPFFDGNKRMSLLACEIFLEINNYTLKASQEEKYFTFIDLAAKKIQENDFITWVKKKTRPSKKLLTI